MGALPNNLGFPAAALNWRVAEEAAQVESRRERRGCTTLSFRDDRGLLVCRDRSCGQREWKPGQADKRLSVATEAGAGQARTRVVR